MKWTKGKKIGWAIAVTAGLLWTAALTPVFIQAHRANRVFSAFGDALVARDYDRAYDLTSDGFRSAMSKQDFVDQQDVLALHLGKLQKVKRLSFDTEYSKDEWSSSIAAKFNFEHAERKFDFKLTREGSDWKVYGYQED